MRVQKLLVLLGVCALLALPFPALAQEGGTGVTAQAYQTVNVRSGPGVRYQVIGQLTSGDVVNVTGRSDTGNNWLQIAFGEQVGWVAYFTVTVIGDPDTLPVVEVAAPTPAAQEAAPEAEPTAETQQLEATTDLYVTAHQRVNVRSGPGVTYTILGLLTPGDSADITGRDSEENDWLRINFNDQEGWVAYFVVEVTGDPDEAPVVEPGDTAVLISQVAESEAEVVVVTRANTNLRQGPSLQTEVLTVIPAGTELEPEARNEANSRLLVTFDDQTGWIATGLVQVTSGNLIALPVAQE